MNVFDDGFCEQEFLSYKINCMKCSGLCCVALYFSKIDGFPEDKEAGVPCVNLADNYKCKIHSSLIKKNMRGCIAYDCFGAGQIVTEQIYKNQDWKSAPRKAQEIYEVFLKIGQIHQILWYLTEAKHILIAREYKREMEDLLEEGKSVINGNVKQILMFDIDSFRDKTNVILKNIIRNVQKELGNSKNKTIEKMQINKKFCEKDIRGEDYSTCCLIASDFSGSTLKGVSLLAADVRGVDFSSANLGECLFLTQGQVNSSQGDVQTILLPHLTRPSHWNNSKS